MTTTLAPPKAFSVWFKDLDRWDVKFFLGHLESKWPTKTLGELVRDHNEKVRPYLSPDKAFRILGVTNTGGVFFAYVAQGKAINQPYKKVDARDLAYNPYRINVGSIGIVPPGLAGNYISPAYIVFSTDESRLNVDYLLLVFKSNWFNPTLRAATAGSVRQSLTYDLLCRLEIPLPPLPVQEEILAFWRAAQEAIAKSRETLAKLESETLSRFFAFLGLKPPKTGGVPKAFAVSWKDFFRWSVSHNQAALNSGDLSRGRYPVMNLGELLSYVQYGTSDKANATGEGTPILRINNIKGGLVELSDLKYIHLPEKTLENLKLDDGDILIIRTSGSRDLVGTCAVFHESGDLVFASYLIRLRVDRREALPDFVAYFINSPLGRQQVDMVSRQIMQNNINSQELRSLRIPVPPLDVQQEIVDMLIWQRQRIAEARKVAEEGKAQVANEVEEMILGIRPVK